MEWKYVKQLINKENIERIEKKYNVKLSESLKDIIIKYNGGRPLKNIFDTENSKERVFKCLLSYNENDRENIYLYDELFSKNYVPFAITEFGDIICINSKNNLIELYLHELDIFEYICKDIEEFFNILYEIG